MKHMTNRALLPALCLGICAAVQFTPARAQQPSQEVNALDFELRSAKTKLDLQISALNRTKEMYKAGQISAAELDTAQGNVNETMTELQRVEHQRTAAIARLAFRKPVTIQLDHATVRQFASALSKATEMSVKVDASVPANASTTLTLDAQGVPLANVLEAIANKTDLMIAPDNGGVILKAWPHLNNQVIRSATAPWSGDWEVPPTVVAAGFGGNRGVGQEPSTNGGFNPFSANQTQDPFAGGSQPPQGGFFGGRGQQPGQFGAPNGQPGQQPGPGFFPGGPGQPGFQGNGPNGMNPMMGMGSPGFSLTSAGNNIIVLGEVGPSDNGEPGVWLTAYAVDGNGFKRLGRTFHPFVNRPRGPQPGRGPDPRGGSAPGQPGIRNNQPGGGDRPGIGR